jgi:hypothetical protein
VSESLVRAFPAQLAPIVSYLAASLPPARLRPAGSITVTSSHAWPALVLAGEPVMIPMRVYNPQPAPELAAELNTAQMAVAAGIYSRHHDGRVRQRWLKTLLDSHQPWAAPFIVQLLGEYVIEICHDISRFAHDNDPATSPAHANIRAFLDENPTFAALTRQRAISYWSCYYRGLHASHTTYPGLTALAMLQRNKAG